MRAVTFLVTLVALLTGFYRYFDSRLDQFYIFDPSHLHDLSQRAIAAHGNDTRAVVNYIVSELEEKTPGTHINHDEEWVFNNAGGAMGAMYIIHASASRPFFQPPLR
jgi:C-8 sterol isomerase